MPLDICRPELSLDRAAGVASLRGAGIIRLLGREVEDLQTLLHSSVETNACLGVEVEGMRRAELADEALHVGEGCPETLRITGLAATSA